MKTPETLNSKHVDIFLIFPTNTYVSPANKPSNGYGHWEIALSGFFDENLKTD
jgi:hypothetical protein